MEAATPNRETQVVPGVQGPTKPILGARSKQKDELLATVPRTGTQRLSQRQAYLRMSLPPWWLAPDSKEAAHQDQETTD